MRYTYLPPVLSLKGSIFVGVPEEVIKRATFVLEANGQNKHVERLCNESISAQDQKYMVLV